MAQRTQVYFTDEQRALIDEIARRTNSTMAEVVRRAVDAYIEEEGGEYDFLDETFGAAKDMEVPSRDEWDHRGWDAHRESRGRPTR